MWELTAIGIGGAFGAIARYTLGNAVNQLCGTEFPYGILIINVLGSLLMGVLFELLVEQSFASPIWRSILMVGFLGAFTTFSTFSMQALGLVETGRLLAAATYVLSSVILSIFALALGIFITRELTA